MITDLQLKNIITYYYLDLMTDKSNSIQTSTQSTKDTIAFNKMRAEICGNVYNIKKFQFAIGIIHHSSTIRQINSVPKNSECCVDKVKIPLNESGVQLICKQNDETLKHIVFQKKYQKIFNYYFNLRWFDKILQEKMRQFFLKQSWYLPSIYKENDLLQKLLSSNFSKAIYKHLELSFYVLDNI